MSLPSNADDLETWQKGSWLFLFFPEAPPRSPPHHHSFTQSGAQSNPTQPYIVSSCLLKKTPAGRAEGVKGCKKGKTHQTLKARLPLCQGKIHMEGSEGRKPQLNFG